MKGTWLQRLRGALGMGLTWAIGWAPIGAVLGAALHMLLPGVPIGLGGAILLNATTFGVLGFLGGSVFAGVLRLTEGRRRFHELSLGRFTLWGAVGGLLLGGGAAVAGLWGGSYGLLGAAMVGVATVLGGASAAGTLMLARQADGPGMLDGGGDAELGGGERTEFLRKP